MPTRKIVSMRIRSLSHVNVGVSDMEASLKFYRDLLGLRVAGDASNENPSGMFANPRHAVYLRWEDGPHASFLVLAENRPISGRPLSMTQVGITHFSFWVDDLEETFERLQAAGVPVVTPPTICDSATYGESPGGRVKTTVFKDPDGALVQLDQRM